MRIGFNGNQLKLIAVVSMLVDHMAYLFIGVGMLTPALQAGEEVPALFLLYRVLRAIGRMAFPVFCFLLVEGFLHTKSRRRYAIRLGIFSLISEIPFDLLTSGTRLFVDWSSQNVMITLFLGLLMMEVLERLDIRKKNILDQGRNYSSGIFQLELMAQLFVIFFFCVAAWIVRCDYDYTGIMLIAIFYWFRWDRKQCALWDFYGWQLSNRVWNIYQHLSCLLFSSFFIMGRGGNGKANMQVISFIQCTWRCLR